MQIALGRKGGTEHLLMEKKLPVHGSSSTIENIWTLPKQRPPS